MFSGNGKTKLYAPAHHCLTITDGHPRSDIAVIIGVEGGITEQGGKERAVIRPGQRQCDMAVAGRKKLATAAR